MSSSSSSSSNARRVRLNTRAQVKTTSIRVAAAAAAATATLAICSRLPNTKYKTIVVLVWFLLQRNTNNINTRWWRGTARGRRSRTKHEREREDDCYNLKDQGNDGTCDTWTKFSYVPGIKNTIKTIAVRRNSGKRAKKLSPLSRCSRRRGRR